MAAWIYEKFAQWSDISREYVNIAGLQPMVEKLCSILNLLKPRKRRARELNHQAQFFLLAAGTEQKSESRRSGLRSTYNLVKM
uniref:Uncharacterized protein n=1 Tax=Rhizobium leguminosarum TaxID=384 RepID=A0A179BW17_RHILE|nr:hypothetical protein A4U53_16180 [Rhizobium leguminosarum]